VTNLQRVDDPKGPKGMTGIRQNPAAVKSEKEIIYGEVKE
jgi:hypothetical protein